MAAFRLLGIKGSRRHVAELMAAADPDGSGAIEFDEFASIMGSSLHVEGVGAHHQVRW